MATFSPDALIAPWLLLWNGDLSQADHLVTEDFVTHVALMTEHTEGELKGREALTAWIRNSHAIMADLKFSVEVGPIANDDYVVIRWRARGKYRDGLPGVPQAAVGRDISFTGTDILRVKQGRLAEYWINADSTVFMRQIGVLPGPLNKVE